MPMRWNPTTRTYEWVEEGEDFGAPPGLMPEPDWREEITAPTPSPFEPPPFAPPPTPEPEPEAVAPPPVEPPPTPPWEEITIPYLGEVAPEGRVFEPEKTELQAWLEETVTGRARGVGIERLTPEKIEEFRPYVEQIMQPRYQQEMRDLSERWRAAGRAVDTEKLASIGRLSIQHNAAVVGQMVGLAKDEVDRINLEMGRAIGQGLTLAQMEQADQHLEASQRFQLDMYKRRIRDEAIAGIENVKIKDYYLRLMRAWEVEDWEAYRDLAEELAEAGQPDMADYLLSLVEAIAPVAILAGAI